jgi:hypothetical protein
VIFFSTNNAKCDFPRRPYNAADLPAEYHSEVWQSLRRAAYAHYCRRAYAETLRPGEEPIRTPQQRRGIHERADEAASAAYADWLSLSGVESIAAGDHHAAVAAILVTWRRRGWSPRTGSRRAAYRVATAERLAAEARLRERNIPDPSRVAEWSDRLRVYRHRRKAGRIAAGIGTTIDRLASYAAGVEIMTTRARFVPDPLPQPINSREPRPPMASVDARHGWVVSPDPDGTRPEVQYPGSTVKEPEVK